MSQTPKTIKLSEEATQKTAKYIPDRWKVKCLDCRQIGQGDTINKAMFAIKHNSECGFEKGSRTSFDALDTLKSSDF